MRCLIVFFVLVFCARLATGEKESVAHIYIARVTMSVFVENTVFGGAVNRAVYVTALYAEFGGKFRVADSFCFAVLTV